MPAHVPEVGHKYINDYNGYTYNIHTFLYDLIVFLFNAVITTFFREIKVRGGYNVPPRGVPTILVYKRQGYDNYSPVRVHQR